MADKSKKSLAVLKYLWENTDELKPATTSDIIKGVTEYGVTLERHILPEIYEDLLSMGVFYLYLPLKLHISELQITN